MAAIPIVGNVVATAVTGGMSVQKDLMELSDWLKIHYVCPKCKRFLGDLPWESLVAQKQCGYCKAMWVRP